MGEENHNLCCVFLQVPPNLHFLLHCINNLLVLIKRPAICHSTLYPNFQRYIQSKLRFTKGRGGGGSKLLHYIQIFDAISELYCIILRMTRRFENKPSLLKAENIPVQPRYDENLKLQKKFLLVVATGGNEIDYQKVSPPVVSQYGSRTKPISFFH